ncbi:50S ribosomal protein L22 [Candidatus Nardonella dryophthoridicola]|uniref:Large ribosomal subunit protein uL22 n=1 Tax=endosymbiont of Metamasius hemipterus TaxID=204627 RepID=A0ABT0TW71_9GAMM|nr:50S ribosomal protein L22 [Candidatus Nardonella dryophthoridicola]MCM0158241.1 50S ribosomal protein L22 [endosymbiont of Metamasius hemipterus]
MEKKILIFSKLNKVKISPYKVRLIVNLIKKENLLNILNILKYTNKKASKLLLKTIESAIYNAKNNFNIDIDNLEIYKIYIDNGPIFKRILLRAKGKFDKLLKRTSIINVILINKNNGTKS